MFYLFYRFYGHFVFRSPQPLLGGERRIARRSECVAAFCSQKVHNPLRGKTAVNHRSKNGNIPGGKDTFRFGHFLPFKKGSDA